MDNFNNLSLVQLILKWKWHILIITVVAAICGAIFSSSAFITPLYKSEAIAYPANISPYSEESETEQMLQIINAQSIADSIIEKYDLWTDYKIDRNYQFAKTYMMLEYHDKIRISKTPYEAVSIAVSDKDPFVACNIAKDILNFYDQKVADLHRQKVGEVVRMYERQLALKQQGIDSLKRELTELGTQYGIAQILQALVVDTVPLMHGRQRTVYQCDMIRLGATGRIAQHAFEKLIEFGTLLFSEEQRHRTNTF